MNLKHFLWIFKRHPFLYIARFKLLSKNSSIEDIKKFNYNKVNKKKDIPNFFNKINDKIFVNGKPKEDLDIVIQLTIWLNNNIKGGRGLSEPSESALKMMLAGDGGVCSDMVQVFNNFCVINDIKVREWGVTKAPFNNAFGGHSFNEVYCEKLNKWVLVDVSNCIMFYLENDTTPLSVIELYQSLRSGDKVCFKSFNESFQISKSNIENNYFDPHIVPFLICNYSNKTYDFFLKYTRPYIPIFMSHFIIFIINKSYYYKFPLDNYKNIF